jgi:hypothetical protein
LIAVYICEELRDYLLKEKHVQGHVHSVFTNACNIETKDKFLTILSKDKYMAPMSITLDNQGGFNFKDLGIKQNFKVEMDVDVFNFCDGKTHIDLYYAETWLPKPVLKASALVEKNIMDNIKLIESEIKTKGKLYGIGPLIRMLNEEIPELDLVTFPIDFFDKNLQFIRNRFINFIKALIECDIENIAFLSEGIIGFGTGLTPSVDDFISGVMVSFIYLGNYYKLNLSAIYEFNKEIVKNGLNKTTKVSSEMLRHTSMGKTNEAVRGLMLSILNELDKEAVIKALNKTINFGETSGTDTALGIYLGCRIMTNLRFRRVWLNEAMH